MSSYSAEPDKTPGLLDRAIAALKGYPHGVVIAKSHKDRRWVEGVAHIYGDGAGPISGGAVLPERWVIAIHDDAEIKCDCNPDEFEVDHVEYYSVNKALFDRLELGGRVEESDEVIDLD